MIYGYAAKASLWPGERLLLHVSCSVARFRVVLYRWIGKLERMLATSWLNGKRAGARGADENWEWPQYDVALPTDLPSGVYIAHLQGRDSADAHIAMTEATTGRRTERSESCIIRRGGRRRLRPSRPSP